MSGSARQHTGSASSSRRGQPLAQLSSTLPLIIARLADGGLHAQRHGGARGARPRLSAPGGQTVGCRWASRVCARPRGGQCECRQVGANQPGDDVALAAHGSSFAPPIMALGVRAGQRRSHHRRPARASAAMQTPLSPCRLPGLQLNCAVFLGLALADPSLHRACPLHIPLHFHRGY